MSQVSALNRDCPVCGNLIQRNWVWFDGELFHWGCLKNSERFGEAVAICVGCFSYLTNKNIVSVDFGGGRAEKNCGLCGYPHLRYLKQAAPQAEVPPQ